ncbi:MAG: hypothetical protein P4M15_00200 [Alphaproteobacteria bacterium]|nr:hypothetical protein [Alphaproteobacteria bacterium]
MTHHVKGQNVTAMRPTRHATPAAAFDVDAQRWAFVRVEWTKPAPPFACTNKTQSFAGKICRRIWQLIFAKCLKIGAVFVMLN